MSEPLRFVRKFFAKSPGAFTESLPLITIYNFCRHSRPQLPSAIRMGRSYKTFTTVPPFCVPSCAQVLWLITKRAKLIQRSQHRNLSSGRFGSIRRVGSRGHLVWKLRQILS